MEDAERKYRRGVKWDMTISLGHVVSIVLMAVTIFTSWSALDKRVVVLEEARQAQRDRDAAQDLLSRDKFQEVKEALNDLRRSVEKVADKVGVTK